MKKRILCSIAASVLFCAGMFAQVFVIERGANTLTYNNLKAAVDALQDNDHLYIPPGRHDISSYTWTGYDDNQNHSGTLAINKKVSIYGAGHSEGANSTVITGSGNGRFVIGRDASGSTITGIRFDFPFQLDNVSNCIVTRCKMTNYFYLFGYGTNINLSECEFDVMIQTGSSSYYSHPNASSGMSSNISKSIFNHRYVLSNANISNSIFLSVSANSVYNIFMSCSLANNIFIISQTVTNSNCHFDGTSFINNSFVNNLWVGGYATSTAERNNAFSNEMNREDYANVFVDPDNRNYRLKDACSGKNAGSDGTDVGIFGTAVPFKESRSPSIPLFRVKVIGAETDAAGKLPVHIVIDAQDR